ncbi:AlpA family phage regulatory protein [Desulfovibrio sp. OttesenSCG-928-C14]|nr:AlpA family phage regulatory protein [Desulfovibrio sp. OttesenSCG-928-C14]
MSNELQQVGFLRLPQVLKLIPVCRATWWAGCRTGRFPRPVKLGPRTTAWRAEDIAALVNKIGSQADEQGGSNAK